MLPGKQSYKLIRADITAQVTAKLFVQVRITNIAQYFFTFLKKPPNVLERVQYIRSARKEAAETYHQVHSVNSILTVESKANRQNKCSYKWLVVLFLLVAVCQSERDLVVSRVAQGPEICCYTVKLANEIPAVSSTSPQRYISTSATKLSATLRQSTNGMKALVHKPHL
jgi:hypothetical protein